MTDRIVRELAGAYDDVSPEGLESALQQLADRLPEGQRTLTSSSWIR